MIAMKCTIFELDAFNRQKDGWITRLFNAPFLRVGIINDKSKLMSKFRLCSMDQLLASGAPAFTRSLLNGHISSM